MAKGYIRSGSEEIQTLKATIATAYTANDLLLNNGLVLLAMNDSAISTEAVYAYAAPKVQVPKEAALAINPGDLVYWVNANNNVNKTSAGNTKCGICVSAALAADTTVLIELRPAF